LRKNKKEFSLFFRRVFDGKALRVKKQNPIFPPAPSLSFPLFDPSSGAAKVVARPHRGNAKAKQQKTARF
jgi:hypothetical protein